MSYANIPDELKRLNQWLVWRYETTDTGKQTKVPYNARTGQRASHSDPSTWSTFEEAVAASGFFSGIGCVVTVADEYCFIDIDKVDNEEDFQRQLRVVNALGSYTEYSPSGEGLHIICKARIPHGRKRAGIEIYDKERYFTFTGNVYKNLPITDQQELVTRLWEEMGPGANPNLYEGDAFAKHFDEEIYNQAANARNGDLFVRLWNGDWRNEYSSQSQADQALMNILAFYSKNRAQLIRMFRLSALGQRDKAKRDKYMEWTVNRAFDMTLPPIDLSALVDNINAAVALNKQLSQLPPVAAASPVIFPQSDNAAPQIDPNMWRTVEPPGILADISRFILACAPRPVPEIALTASLALIAGICGRSYNISGDGLNVYLMMLAETGRGKESMSRGINRLISAVAGSDFPSAWDFIGPSNMASGPGLLKHLAEHPQPCFVSLTGEIGLRLQQMAHPNANMADKTLQSVLLDVYGKSGAGQVVRPTVYSDKKNNVPNINSPAFTWLGESTQSEFYKALTEHQIASGLLPRFVIIDYNGPRVDLNPSHATAHPTHKLIEEMRSLITASLEINRTGNVVHIGMTREAVELSELIDLHATHKINAYGAGPLVHLWNRVHLNTLKLSGVLAVSLNHYQPIIDANMLRWAYSLIKFTVDSLAHKFETGQIGRSVVTEANGVIARGIVTIMEGRKTLSPTDQLLARDGVISRTMLSQVCLSYTAFKQDKKLFAETIAELEKLGVLVRLSKVEAAERYLSRAELFQVANPQWCYDNLPSA